MLRFYDIVRRKDLKLYFPPKFVEEHARNLRDMIVLEVADGETWDVKLKKGDHDHEVWLTKGWSEFAKFYSIQPGHLLQFTYEGNSHFHVIIFGISAMEIDYPSSFHCLEVKEEYDSDASVQIVEHFPTYYPKRNKRAAPTDQILQPHKTNLTHHKGTEAGKTKTTVPPKRNLSAESTRGLKFPKQKGRHNHGLFMSSTKIGQRSEISRLQASAFERAKDFKSDYPFFTVPMQPTYARGFYMNIPVTFVEKYLGHKDIKFNIRYSNGRTWAVEYVYQITGRPKAKFKAGWKEFVRDNDVEVGDVCAFELINMDQGVNLLQHVPMTFIEEHIEGKDIMVILQDSAGTTWPVRFQKVGGQARFTAGWLRFARDKKLKPNDFLKFELIEEAKQITFQVSKIQI